MNIPRPEPKQPIPKHAKKVFEGILFDIYQWKQELFDGTIETFERAARKHDGVSICSVLENGNIIVIEQEQPLRKPYRGVPGGMIDPGETPEQTAARELREEAGCSAEHVQLWFSHQPITKVDYAVYVFVATGCKKVGDLTLDPGEKIVAREVSFEEFLDIAIQPDFLHVDITLKIWEAKSDPKKMQELKELFGIV